MIRFERVTYTYPFQTCPAVSDISFSVRPGELVLCTGASGCGKSTLMRLANGLCPHYFQGTLEGRVLIGGEPTDARPINAIAREAGTLFQDPEQQFFALNVEDELAFAHEWQGVSPEAIAAKIDEAARAFRLGPILSSSIHELSEGQKQKVGLASILSQGPRALILDEPSANLDPEATEDLACKLAELKERGMAILVVDHRLYWLEGIADRVLVMREGRIAERGGFDMLYDDALRGRCGLRAARVDDPRRTLPDCAEELLEPGEGGLAVSGLRFAYSGKPALFDGRGRRTGPVCRSTRTAGRKRPARLHPAPAVPPRSPATCGGDRPPGRRAARTVRAGRRRTACQSRPAPQSGLPA